MSTNTIETAEPAPEVSAQRPKRKQPAAKKAKPAKKSKKSPRERNAARKSSKDRANKKADVIALMNRVKGVTLAEIMEATGWQEHTVRGFVSILGNKGGERSNHPRTTRKSAPTVSPNS